jgi:ferredoxin
VLTIKHVDCTLCGECIYGCKSNALSINNRKWIKWFIPVIILVLFLSGIIVSNKWEVPMVNLKWDESDTLKLETVEIKGLRSVKCYASSINFAKKTQNIKGVYGVKTFIQHHRVELLYNPTETCVDSIKKAIYTPVKFKISQPGKDVRQIKVITLHTENMTDPIDVNYLGMQLRTEKKRYYGLTSEYSEPLTLRLYIDIKEPVDVDYIRKIIEMSELTIQMHGGKTQKVKVDFKFIDASPQIDTITKRALLEVLFRPYKKIFKEETTDLLSAEHYDIVYPDIEKPLVARNLPYLSNYLSQTEGILGVETLLNSDDEPTIRIYFTKESTNKETIQSLISRKKWTIKTREGNIKEIDSPIGI